MKRFMLVVITVLCLIAILAACAPLQSSVEEGLAYTQTLPEWAIVAGAIIIFLIGLAIILKLISGFVKFIVIIVLAVALIGISIGIWPKPDIENTVNDLIDNTVNTVESLTKDLPIDDLADILDGDASETDTESPEASEKP